MMTSRTKLQTKLVKEQKTKLLLDIRPDRSVPLVLSSVGPIGSNIGSPVLLHSGLESDLHLHTGAILNKSRKMSILGEIGLF